jgi:hypothetical protein
MQFLLNPFAGVTTTTVSSTWGPTSLIPGFDLFDNTLPTRLGLLPSSSELTAQIVEGSWDLTAQIEQARQEAVSSVSTAVTGFIDQMVNGVSSFDDGDKPTSPHSLPPGSVPVGSSLTPPEGGPVDIDVTVGPEEQSGLGGATVQLEDPQTSPVKKNVARPYTPVEIESLSKLSLDEASALLRKQGFTPLDKNGTIFKGGGFGNHPVGDAEAPNGAQYVRFVLGSEPGVFDSIRAVSVKGHRNEITQWDRATGKVTREVDDLTEVFNNYSSLTREELEQIVRYGHSVGNREELKQGRVDIQVLEWKGKRARVAVKDPIDFGPSGWFDAEIDFGTYPNQGARNEFAYLFDKLTGANRAYPAVVRELNGERKLVVALGEETTDEVFPRVFKLLGMERKEIYGPVLLDVPMDVTLKQILFFRDAILGEGDLQNVVRWKNGKPEYMRVDHDGILPRRGTGDVKLMKLADSEKRLTAGALEYLMGVTPELVLHMGRLGKVPRTVLENLLTRLFELQRDPQGSLLLRTDQYPPGGLKGPGPGDLKRAQKLLDEAQFPKEPGVVPYALQAELDLTEGRPLNGKFEPLRDIFEIVREFELRLEWRGFVKIDPDHYRGGLLKPSAKDAPEDKTQFVAYQDVFVKRHPSRLMVITRTPTGEHVTVLRGSGLSAVEVKDLPPETDWLRFWEEWDGEG